MRLIDADDLIARIDKAVQIMDIDSIPAPYIRQCVAEIPTIGIESLVEHGRWLLPNKRQATYLRRCSCCGKIAYFCGSGCSYKYCPNCGAKMDLEE